MHAVVLVLIEVLIVIGLSRLMGLGCRFINQPLVIGEIIAGIMLGPSLFGLIAPDLAANLFPAETLPFLDVLSQAGLIFFMFLIGLDAKGKLRFKAVWTRKRSLVRWFWILFPVHLH
jgi:Kef-type K+ transport system membrane component KefB